MPSYSKTVQIPGKNGQELYEIVAKEIEAFLSKANLGQFDIKRDAGSKKVDVKSKMFSATLACTDGQMKLDGSLSLLATPFKSKIDEGIDRWVEKTFNASKA